jgi:hypothetical protein
MFLGRSIAVLFFMVLDFVTCVTIGHVDVQTVALARPETFCLFTPGRCMSEGRLDPT